MRLFSLLAFALLLCAGCTSQPASDSSAGADREVSPEKPIQVVATVGMVADLVRAVGGDLVELDVLCGPGVDPHLHQPSRDDSLALTSAEMVFYCGLMLEGKMSDILINQARSRPVIAVTEALEQSQLLEPEAFGGHFDPHVWMDVSAWEKCLEPVVTGLSEFDPAHAEFYQENAARYREEMQALHAYGKKVISSIPETSRVLITSHDAFNYLGRAYGLDVQGIQGISTESEAGLQRVNELVDLLVEKNVKSVFIESSVPPKSVYSLIEGARARGHEVTVGGELYSDAMGSEGTYEGTYIGMLDHNLTLIARALGGEAPEKGLNGKLTAPE
ncbi:MAG: manganese transporter [Planctomyces sp.]|nr:manganese transporter [Planctomyces sp.]